MPVIAVANPKGGVGKTTLSTNIAGYYASRGHAVMLGDVDRQQSARTWLGLRPAGLAPLYATRAEGWLTQATSWVPMTTLRFAAWVRRHLLRVLRPGDIVIMDNLSAHKSRRVQELVASGLAWMDHRLRLTND